jgi:hypothetical protein
LPYPEEHTLPVIQGRVVDAESGKGVENALITIFPTHRHRVRTLDEIPSTRSDVDGYFKTREMNYSTCCLAFTYLDLLPLGFQPPYDFKASIKHQDYLDFEESDYFGKSVFVSGGFYNYVFKMKKPN